MELRVTIPADELQRLADHVLDLVGDGQKPARVFVGTAEACRLLDCSRQRLYDLRSSGRLTRYGDGRRALYSVHELEHHAKQGVTQ